MKSIDLLSALTRVQDGYVLESALPTPPVASPVSRRRERGRARRHDRSLGRVFSEGWLVAAVCTLVTIGTLSGMIYLGQNPPPLPPISTDGTAAPDTSDTAPVTEGVVTASLVFVSHGDGTCSVKASDSFGSDEEDAHLVIPATSPTGETVVAVADYGFIWKREIRTVILPETVTRLGQWAFAECAGLESVTLPVGLQEIGTAAFLSCSSLTAVVVPEGVVSMGDSAFSSCTALRSASLPSTLKALPQWGFYGCSSLTEIHFSEGLEIIGYCSFYGCTALRTVNLPDSIRTLDKGGFASCTSLLSVALPEGVTEVGLLTFDGCTKLVSVTLPRSMQALGSTALRSCTALRTVIFTGTKAEWKVLSEDADISEGCSVHCSDGTVLY